VFLPYFGRKNLDFTHVFMIKNDEKQHKKGVKHPIYTMFAWCKHGKILDFACHKPPQGVGQHP